MNYSINIYDGDENLLETFPTDFDFFLAVENFYKIDGDYYEITKSIYQTLKDKFIIKLSFDQGRSYFVERCSNDVIENLEAT